MTTTLTVAVMNWKMITFVREIVSKIIIFFLCFWQSIRTSNSLGLKFQNYIRLHPNKLKQILCCFVVVCVSVSNKIRTSSINEARQCNNEKKDLELKFPRNVFFNIKKRLGVMKNLTQN